MGLGPQAQQRCRRALRHAQMRTQQRSSLCLQVTDPQPCPTPTSGAGPLSPRAACAAPGHCLVPRCQTPRRGAEPAPVTASSPPMAGRKCTSGKQRRRAKQRDEHGAALPLPDVGPAQADGVNHVCSLRLPAPGNVGVCAKKQLQMREAAWRAVPGGCGCPTAWSHGPALCTAPRGALSRDAP